MRAEVIVAALLGVTAVYCEPRQAEQLGPEPFDPSMFGADLKPGPNRDLVLANCFPCHSTALVAANHMSRERWDKTITTMQQVNGMWPLPDEVRKGILDYLEKAQRVEDSALDTGKSSPWAAPLYRPNPLWK